MSPPVSPSLSLSHHLSLSHSFSHPLPLSGLLSVLTSCGSSWSRWVSFSRGGGRRGGGVYNVLYLHSGWDCAFHSHLICQDFSPSRTWDRCRSILAPLGRERAREKGEIEGEREWVRERRCVPQTAQWCLGSFGNQVHGPFTNRLFFLLPGCGRGDADHKVSGFTFLSFSVPLPLSFSHPWCLDCSRNSPSHRCLRSPPENGGLAA